MLLNHVACLDCNHKARFATPPPSAGDVVWCVRCDDTARVIVVLKPWRARCATCHHLNIHGDSEVQVRTEALAHVETRHHRVWIWGVGSGRHYLLTEDGQHDRSQTRIVSGGNVPQGTLER